MSPKDFGHKLGWGRSWRERGGGKRRDLGTVQIGKMFPLECEIAPQVNRGGLGGNQRFLQK